MAKSKYLIVLVIVMLCAQTVVAQPGTPPGTPIDGGLGALLAGGILYGISRIKKFKK